MVRIKTIIFNIVNIFGKIQKSTKMNQEYFAGIDSTALDKLKKKTFDPAWSLQYLKKKSYQHESTHYIGRV